MWLYFRNQWELNHKVTFDGINKLITVGANVFSISVKVDIYSAWKEWVQLYDYSKFDPAIRVTGGDPIGGGQYSGDLYFTINGWRILIDHSCNIDGTIYSDDYPSPFVQVSGTNIVTNKVSALVSVVAPQVTIDGITVPTALENAAATWSSPSRTLTEAPAYSGPTAIQIREEIDVNSLKLAQIKAIVESMDIPTSAQNAAAVWTAPVSTMTDKTTIGGYIAKLVMTIPKFLGLK